ncbi:MAG: TonB family protein [Verrucomicrobiales bacterium]|jgi:TonB family protein
MNAGNSSFVRQDFNGWFAFVLGIHALLILGLAWAFANRPKEIPLTLSASASGGAAFDVEQLNWIDQLPPEIVEQAIEQPIQTIPALTPIEPKSDIALPESPQLPKLTKVPDPPKLEPVPAPKPTPTPKLEPVPKPRPEPKLTRVPTPKPPQKSPPKLEPAPRPKPNPRLTPAPNPKPVPQLDPVPRSDPRPRPQLDPAPGPRPDEKLTKVTPLPIRPRIIGGSGTGNGEGTGTAAAGGGNSQSAPTPQKYGSKGAYRTHIYNAFNSNWRRPGAIQTGGQRLRTVVQLRISPSGQILEARIIQSSGNPEMDESVRRAILKVQKVDPPPDIFENNSYSGPLNFDI